MRSELSRITLTPVISRSAAVCRITAYNSSHRNYAKASRPGRSAQYYDGLFEEGAATAIPEDDEVDTRRKRGVRV